MQFPRGLSQISYQFFIGVIIGLTLSLFFNQISFGSIWSGSENGAVSKFFSGQNVIAKVANEKLSSHNKVRVLCWVMTYPKNHRTQAIHVKRTWGKRCDKLLFISSKKDSVLDTVAVQKAGDDRDWLWGKTKAAFKYAWENYKDEFDWIIKADDDTYVIMENLKTFLSNYSSTDPIFFGCEFRSNEIPSWVSGGAGYVLSKEAVRRFVLGGITNPWKCRPDHEGAEDAELAICLSRLGVTLEDSRDSFGRHRFLAFPPVDHLFPHTLDANDNEYWYWKDLAYPQVQGMDCCANDAITFHYISNRDMYVFEYFLYHIRPHGVHQEQKYVQEFPLEYAETTGNTTNPDVINEKENIPAPPVTSEQR